MSALKSPENTPPEASTRPYPSWNVVATTVGGRQGLEAVDRQASKEARIWRELAEEPRSDDHAAQGARHG